MSSKNDSLAPTEIRFFRLASSEIIDLRVVEGEVTEDHLSQELGAGHPPLAMAKKVWMRVESKSPNIPP